MNVKTSLNVTSSKKSNNSHGTDEFHANYENKAGQSEDAKQSQRLLMSLAGVALLAFSFACGGSSNNSGDAPPPSLITAGSEHSCGTLNGAPFCWGDGGNGRLGNNSTDDSDVPVQITGLTSGVTSISAGGAHTCTVAAGGAAMCWGAGKNSRLGNNSTEDSDVPVQVTGLTSGVTAISAGGFHTCAVVNNGAAMCWGAGNNGRLGNNSTDNSDVPVQVTGLASGVTAISAGNSHTCALVAGGGAMCWGSNGIGELGVGTTGTLGRRTPVAVVTGVSTSRIPLTGVTAISAGNSHTCAVVNNGKAMCWGSNGDGQLGDGTTTQRATPVAVVTDVSTSRVPLTGVTAISAGANHSCAVVNSGKVMCWGAGNNGRLGDDSATQRNTAVAVVTGVSTSRIPLTGVTVISAGESHSCALAAGGKAMCWGLNGSGRLGDGTTTQRPVPTAVNAYPSNN